MNDYELNGTFFIKFLKIDPDYKIVKGEEYTIMSIDEENNNGIVITNTNNQYGLFDLSVDPSSSNNLLNLIPKPIKQELSKINSIDDILSLPQKDSLYSVQNIDLYNYYEVSVQFPIRLKQTKSIDGYKENNIIYTPYVYIDYYYDNNNITKKEIVFSNWNNYQGIIQSKSIPSYTKLSDITKFKVSDTQESCINSDSQGRIITDSESCTVRYPFGSGTYNLVPYFINQKGTANLKITNTVNGLAKYNASKDNNLKYKIEVTNIGDAASGNNVIVTYVPSLVEVDEKNISNNGTYNKDNHTITWNIAHIGADETVIVTYNATAPETAKNKELIGKSTVKSDQVPAEVQSTNTIVTLDRIIEVIKNPETGTMVYIANTNIGIPLSVVAMFVIILAIGSSLIVRKYHINKKSSS